MMENIINIGVAQLAVAENPGVLRTILGSCVGICIYERNKKIGGLAHILLPKNPGDSNPEKYADTAIPVLVQQLIKRGCKKEFMSAKIAGGASMFKFKSTTTLANIGENNIEATRQALAKYGIPIVAEDVGGSTGRVIDFFLDDGRLKVKASGQEKIYYKV
ncbi:MAG: chemotaxis protein CheD [Spirochaetota bacterium]